VPPNPRRALAAAWALAALALPASALAQSSGVHVDPNSPPGKEYAIPLQTARSQGGGSPSSSSPAVPTGGTKIPSPSSTPAPAAKTGLFGAGIAPAPAHHARRTPTRTSAASTPPVTPASAPRRASSAERGGGGSTAMFWVLAALAVLVPGLAVGLGVRRWRQV
jgi:hypothetical protein